MAEGGLLTCKLCPGRNCNYFFNTGNDADTTDNDTDTTDNDTDGTNNDTGNTVKDADTIRYGMMVPDTTTKKHAGVLKSLLQYVRILWRMSAKSRCDEVETFRSLCRSARSDESVGTVPQLVLKIDHSSYFDPSELVDLVDDAPDFKMTADEQQSLVVYTAESAEPELPNTLAVVEGAEAERPAPLAQPARAPARDCCLALKGA